MSDSHEKYRAMSDEELQKLIDNREVTLAYLDWFGIPYPGGLKMSTTNQFQIDLASSDDERLYVDLPSVGATVEIRVTHEGVIIDLLPFGNETESAGCLAITFDDIHEAWEKEMAP